MTTTREDKHTFVGIDIQFMGDGTATDSMNAYIIECISIYGDNVKKAAATPAKGGLFEDDNGHGVLSNRRR